MPRYVGLMSGTSLDAIDAALLNLDGDTLSLEAHHSHPIAPTLRSELLALCEGTDTEIERAGIADRLLGATLADATLALLDKAGVSTRDITAIGSHGQTIRHRPPDTQRSPSDAFTLQIGDPSTIAEITGVTTVADFRRRDIAAGGQGAPLVPAFHAAIFASPSQDRIVANIGGMANISVLHCNGAVRGFDTGPGNVLMDCWAQHQLGEPFDRDGHWAASGQVVAALLDALLADPFYKISGPKSTGREQFSLGGIQNLLRDFPGLAAEDVQATLLELTAVTLGDAISQQNLKQPEIYLCGGGAANSALRKRIAERVSPAVVDSTQALGLDPDWVEAAAFAWLAHATLNKLSGNVPAVTGAQGDRILGAIYPA